MNVNKQIRWLLIHLSMTFLLAFLVNKDITLLSIINTLFFIAIFYLILWLSLVIVKGGFFDGVVFGFRKVGKNLFQKNLSVEWEEKPDPSKVVKLTYLPFFRFQALGLCCVLLILLIIFYL